MSDVNLKYNFEENLWYKVSDDVPYTGEVSQPYEGSDQEESNTRFSGGKIDGVTVVWYEDGTKKSEINFADGERDGLASFWREDGSLRTRILYREGKISLANSWDEKGGEKDPLVEFYYESESAKRVLVVGDFTNWEDNPLRMDKVDDKLWFKRVILPKGEYQYKYKVDDVWVDDPFCTTKVLNEFGEKNCFVKFDSIDNSLQEDLIKKKTVRKEIDHLRNRERSEGIV